MSGPRQQNESWSWVLVACVTLGHGCSSAPSQRMIREASEEWSCPESRIEVTRQGNDVFRVSGCGQSALYVCSNSSPPPAKDPHVQLGSEEEYRVQNSGSCYRLKKEP